MYPNMNAELARKGITPKSLAKIWGVSEASVYLKLKGKSPIKLKEIMQVKEICCPDKTIDYLVEVRSEKYATS